jgi:hypothetical protein
MALNHLRNLIVVVIVVGHSNLRLVLVKSYVVGMRHSVQ